MEFNQETNKKIEELQVLEAQMQNFLAQKQTVQIEFNEIENALEELKNSDGDVYKVVSGVMIKSTKDKLTKELKEKKKLLDLKISSMEKQERLLEKDSAGLRRDIKKFVSQDKNKK